MMSDKVDFSQKESHTAWYLIRHPALFIANRRKFYLEMKKEFDGIVFILTKDPSSPKPAENPTVLSDESISDTVSRFSKLGDEFQFELELEDSDEEVPLIPKKPSEKKSSCLQQPAGEKSKSSKDLSEGELEDEVPLIPNKSSEKKSSCLQRPAGEKSKRSASPIRNKIRKFFVEEYEKLRSKWTKAASPPKSAYHADKEKTRHCPCEDIRLILKEIELLDYHLTIYNRSIDTFEKTIMDEKEWPVQRYSKMRALESLQNTIYYFYHKYVVKFINKRSDVRDYMEQIQLADETASEEHETADAPSTSRDLEERASSKEPLQHSSKAGPSSASQEGNVLDEPSTSRETSEDRRAADAPSTPKKLGGRASSKAPLKHSSKAGPSTASQKGNVHDEPSTSKSTPKRTKTRSVSRQEKKKKKKVSPKSKSKSGSTFQGTVYADKNTVHFFSSSESSDSDSRATVSPTFDSSVNDLNLSEKEDSKDNSGEN